MDMTGTKLIIFCLAFESLFRIGTGHSFLVVPRGDFQTFNKAECRQGGPSHSPHDNCKGPCISKESWLYNPHEGITTYQRGQVVDMVWTKNNHRGGFVRFTLVPESERMNEAAHGQFAFRYACYDSDKHDCTFDTSTERRCGTDTFLQRTKVEIPTSLEDGNYILGWAWFGGLDSEHKSMFSDYWSCSRVKIRGGLLTESYAPIFNPGENLKQEDPQTPTCVSSTAMLRDCAVEPCLGRAVFPRVPAKFADGKKPPSILRRWTSAVSGISSLPKLDGPRSLPAKKPVAYVVGLRLIDVDTKKTLAKKFFRQIHVPKSSTRLSFIATIRGDAQAVSFYIENKFVRVERELPFSAFGDAKGEVYSWPKPIYNKWVNVKVVVSSKNGNKHQKTFDMFLQRAR